MTNILKYKNKIIAVALAFVMVFGALVFVSPTEAQAVSLNATDTGFYNIAYGTYGETIFGAGTQIRVINATRENKNKSDAVYQVDGDMNWAPVDSNNYIVWDGSSDNTFYGVYPYNAEYDSFTIPTDQSGGVQVADWMTDDFTAKKSESSGVNLNFEHRLAKVTVRITAFTSQFDEYAYLKDATIYSLSNDYITVNGGIKPVLGGDAATAIVCPGKYAAGTNFMEIIISDDHGDTTLSVPVNDFLTDTGLEAGYHYTFDLTVGKEAIRVEFVRVTPWTQKDIDGGVAEAVEVTTVINGTTATITVPDIATDAMVQNAMNKLTAAGLTTIIVDGPLNEIRQGYIAAALADKTVTLYLTQLTEDELIDALARTDDGITVNCGYYVADASTYVVYNADGLLAWNTYAQTNTATNLSLAKDITLTLAENATSNWTSVGTESAPYMGTVDGNGYSITGMTINQTTVDAGFIGYLGENGVVKNLKLKDVSVTSTADYVGGVVGRVNNSCVIENCAVEGGMISSSVNYVGGIVGYEPNYNSTNIIACHNTATVKGDNYTGGIIGRAGEAKIIACYNSGSISISSPYYDWECGGIVGLTVDYEPIVCCNYNTGATNSSLAIIGRVSVRASRNHNYWSSDHKYANGTNIWDDYDTYGATKITSASEWETAMTTMNTWLADNGYAYRYVLNTDAATKAAQPLIIVKVS